MQQLVRRVAFGSQLLDLRRDAPDVRVWSGRGDLSRQLPQLVVQLGDLCAETAVQEEAFRVTASLNLLDARFERRDAETPRGRVTLSIGAHNGCPRSGTGVDSKVRRAVARGYSDARRREERSQGDAVTSAQSWHPVARVTRAPDPLCLSFASSP